MNERNPAHRDSRNPVRYLCVTDCYDIADALRGHPTQDIRHDVYAAEQLLLVAGNEYVAHGVTTTFLTTLTRATSLLLVALARVDLDCARGYSARCQTASATAY